MNLICNTSWRSRLATRMCASLMMVICKSVAARYSRRLFSCQGIGWRTGSATPALRNTTSQSPSDGQGGGVRRPATSPLFLGARRRCAKTARVAGRGLSNSKDAKDFLAIQLHTSVDGRGLKQQGQTPSCKHLGDRWVCPPLGGATISRL